jgi:trimeric autotransporter adhesin
MTNRFKHSKKHHSNIVRLLGSVSATALLLHAVPVSAQITLSLNAGTGVEDIVVTSFNNDIDIGASANYNTITLNENVGATDNSSPVEILDGAIIVNGLTVGPDALILARDVDTGDDFADAEAIGIENESADAPLMINNGEIVAYAEGQGDIGGAAEAKGIEQDVIGEAGVIAEVQNNNLIEAEALALGGTELPLGELDDSNYAFAEAKGIDQYMDADGGTAEALVTNSDDGETTNGVIRAIADSYASAAGGEILDADGESFAEARGVDQVIRDTSEGTATVENEGGLIEAYSDSLARTEFGETEAWAESTAVYQDVESSGIAEAYVNNTAGGTIFADAFADSVAGTDGDDGEGAYGEALARGVEQDVEGESEAIAQTDNADGTIEAIAEVIVRNDNDGDGSDDAIGTAIAEGVDQWAEGEAAEAIVNNGIGENGESALIRAEAIAAAEATLGETEAIGEAYASGIEQTVSGVDTATATVNNDGTVEAFADATAYGVESSDVNAFAGAFSSAVNQEAEVESGGTAIADLVNTSSNSLTAYSEAEVFTIFDGRAEAEAVAVEQDAEGGDEGSTLTQNTGLIEGEAVATWHGESDGSDGSFDLAAEAYAGGVDQYAQGDSPGTLLNEFDAFALVENGQIGLGEIVPGAEIRAIADAYGYGNLGEGGESDPDLFVEAEAVGVQQTAEAGYNARAITRNYASILAEASAYAEAISGEGETFDVEDGANAAAFAFGVEQESDGSESAISEVTNTSLDSIRAISDAHAFGDDEIYSLAEANGVEQDANSYENADTQVYNTGLIEGEATAYTQSREYGESFAEARGVDQWVNSFEDAHALVNNGTADDPTGEIIAEAYATAEADLEGDVDPEREAYAEADANGVEQTVRADLVAAATINNYSSITADAHASATTDLDDIGFEDDAWAYADANGVDQYVFGDDEDGESATANLYNYSLDTISAHASAFAHSADGEAEAETYGAYQEADSAVVTNTYTENTGTIEGESEATAFAEDEAFASADSDGLRQLSDSWTTGAGAGESATAEADNEGYITAMGTAIAAGGEADGEGDYPLADLAIASAEVHGLHQTAEDAETGTADIYNTNIIDAVAHAEAWGEEAGGEAGSGTYAYAEALGTLQRFYEIGEGDANANLYNGVDGEITAFASAESNILAAAYAAGHTVEAFDEEDGVENLVLDIENDGIISGESEAHSTGDEWGSGAEAFGIDIHSYDGESVGNTPINGTIYNSLTGIITATSHAENDGGVPEFIGAASVGIHMQSMENNTTTTNEGLIYAYAEVLGDAETLFEASATGIEISSDGNTDGEGLATILNDGGIIFAAQSAAELEEDLAANTERGYAINTFDAPNPVEILWQGNERDGYIAGNVVISDDDEINVTSGTTFLDGDINSDVPDGEGGPENIGDLNIYDDGKLVLVQPGWWDNRTWPMGPENGPDLGTETWWPDADAPVAYVENFMVGETGTLALQLNADNEFGDYGQVNATNITLDEGSTLSAQFAPDLYEDFFVYEEVLESPNPFAGVGEFTNLVDNSALLETDDVYYNDGNEFMDIEVTRLGFGDVEGLTSNEMSVGDAIEAVYDEVVLNPGDYEPFTSLVENLFVLDEEDYPLILQQFSGAEHAQNLQSTLWSTRAATDIITERMQCAGPGQMNGQINGQINGMAEYGCFIPEQAQVWARGYGRWNTHDGDSNAPGYSEDQAGFIAGVDYAFNSNWFGGIAGGYFNSNLDFDSWGGRAGADFDYDGFQVAGYGGYDNGTWYARGVGIYGSYDGESQRLIQFGESPIDPSGEFSSTALRFYGETGYRFALGGGGSSYGADIIIDEPAPVAEPVPNYYVIPFAGLSYASAHVDGFTETDDPNDDPTGARLRVGDSSADSLASRLGVRFTGNAYVNDGMFSPELMVAWEHEFGDTTQSVDMAFADAPDGANFTVESAETARDSVLVDAGGSFKMGNMELGLYYNGRFNESFESHGVTGRLGMKF